VPIAKLLVHIIFHIKTKKDEKIKKIKGPFIAIGTHSTVMDVAFMITALAPKRLNIVCGRDVFSWKPVKPIVGLAGLIPISQFDMDISGIRLMKKAVDNGCSLAFFPEGKISLDGRPLHYLSPSIAKLIKFIRVPIIMCHNSGGYCSWPRWSKKLRRGAIEQKVSLLLSKKEIEVLSTNEIHARLKEAFSYNDVLYQFENNISYKTTAPAKGLDYILYKCPRCGTEYQMASSDRELFCFACDNRVEYTEDGRLIAKDGGTTFDRIDLWYDYERASVRKEIKNIDFYESHPVIWEINENNNYNENGRGDLYIDRENIGFSGKDFNGNLVEIKFPLKTKFTIVQKTKEAVDLTQGGVVHRFYFCEGKYSVKYTLIVEESYKQIHGLNIIDDELTN
jgi:DNA-directed RNA polymerase subunit RPC12/RpoP